MRILHTESSDNWGGQEIRILREAVGLRARGHDIVIAVQEKGKLAFHARKAGFIVYEVPFQKSKALKVIWHLRKIIRDHQIDIVNTHSSTDAWLGGIAGKWCGKKVIRTRHLSTPIRKGINSRLLYGKLADYVVTTSSGIIEAICKQANIAHSRCRCIPTGVDSLSFSPVEVKNFRESVGAADDTILIGTVCIVRSWKGIKDFMKAADLLRGHKNLKWVVVGGGYIEQYRDYIDTSGILTFTGHIDPPYAAIASLDIFALLSTAHEGISQASLQASFLSKPLITTDIGGLPEVCLDGVTGFVVPPASHEKVAEAVLKLAADKELREKMGAQARKHALANFTFSQTLDQMEQVYEEIQA